jgi:hypothetical protein
MPRLRAGLVRGSVVEVTCMSLPLTLEDGLIFACARADPDVPRIEELVDRGPDWEAILRKAERWGMAPLVYVNVRQAGRAADVPQPVAEILRHRYHRDALHGVAQRAALRTILLRLAEARVPVIVLKGAALAALVYPSPTLRPMRDIDLLVHGRDRARVDALVGSLREASARAHGSDPHVGPERFGLLDIGCHICRPPLAARMPIEDFWQRARPAQIESVATRVFSPEDLLLHLGLHLTIQLADADRCVGGVRTLCDIGATCRRYGEGIDWRRLVTQAKAYGIAKQLAYAFGLARDLVGGAVPARALEDLRAGFGRLPREERLVAAVARRAMLSDQESAASRSLRDTLGVELLQTRHALDGVVTAWRLLARTGRAHVGQLLTRPARWWRARAADDDGAAPKREETAPRSARLGPTPGEVAITYDQTATDGVGAQLQRIYALYALARALGVKYVHSPLGRVGYQGLLSLLTGRTDPDFVARYNAFFSLPSDGFDLEGCERVRVPYLSEKQVEHYREHAAATGRSVLLRVHDGYAYTERHPAAYLALRAVSPYRGYRPEGPVRVCIHLRRGDNSVPGRDDQRRRVLPNSYYLRACGAVVDALRQQGASFVVRLHTEVPRRRYTLHPGISGVYFRLDEPATLDPEECALEEFDVLPNLQILLNVEPREALDDFATADVLILSLSSFGYLGGLLNPHGLVISAPSFHAALPDWLVASEHGDLDATQLATRIADHLRGRRESHEV